MDNKETTEAEKKVPKTKKYDLDDWRQTFDLVRSVKDTDELTIPFSTHIQSKISESGIKDNVLFLYDEDSITDYTSDRIYSAISRTKKGNVLLIVHSPGGSIEPAYFISKVVKDLSDKFTVAIPRKAKSAATLLSLGADEIHMGTMSQLGPIDPQINGLPALGVSNAVEHIAEICQKYPGASDMFAKYLALKVEPGMFGYFERITESAEQYAHILLKGRSLPKSENGQSVEHSLVYEYKDHGFVIDKDEAKKILGDSIIKVDTPEYKLAEKIYTFLEEVGFMVKISKGKKLSLVGNINDGFSFRDDK